MSSKLLNGRTAIITGAARGLGAGVTRAMARAGAAVVLFSRDRERMTSIVDELNESGFEALQCVVDVGDRNRVDEALARAIERFGQIDILVNNAGVAPSTPFLSVTDTERDHVLNVNFNGVWNCCQAVLPAMIERGYGKVINISSVTGPLVSGKGMAAYAASKGAVSALTRTLALEMASEGINVNTICPGSFDTPMMRELAAARGDDPSAYLHAVGASIPLGRMGSAHDLGSLAVFLASDAASYITGAEIVIDGGNVIQEH